MEKNAKPANIYDVGVAYLIRRDTQLDFSVGTGAVGSTPPGTFLSVGIGMRF